MFGDGNTVVAIVVASIGIWLFHFMILRGVQQAAFINTVVTIAKIVPIVVFILILIFAFKLDMFARISGAAQGMPRRACSSRFAPPCWSPSLCFSASKARASIRAYAKERSDVGSATILGFAGVTTLMVLVTMLPYAGAGPGRNRRHAAAVDGGGAGGGRRALGRGLYQRRPARLGARRLSRLVADLRRSAVRRGQERRTCRKVFATENENKVPAAALWLTNIVVQLFVISTYWSNDAFSLMLNLTSVMSLIPFLLVAAYGLMLIAARRDLRDAARRNATGT